MLVLVQSRIDPAMWMYLGFLLLMIIFGGFLIFALRAKLFSHDDLNSSSTGGGLMEHLDSMLKDGKITKEEYDQTRRAIIDNAMSQVNPPHPDDQSPNPTRHEE